MSVFAGADNFEKRTLPSGYTQLEYIQSSGTQYIDTGFKQTSEKMKIECDILIPSWVNGVCLFGTQNGTSSLDFSITCGTASGNVCNFFVGTKLNVLSLNMATGTEHNLICEANNGTLTVTLDGSTITGSYTGSLNKTLPFAIFGNNTNGSIGQLSSYRLKKFKIYDNGALVRDFVPCKNSSGTIGLIDLVNSVFYANAGSGTFTAGATYLSGVAREVDAIDIGVSAVAREVTEGWLGISGIAREVWGMPRVGDLSVGEIVYMNVNNISKEFIVVHQGLPSSMYDSTCDGTWLLMKDSYVSMVWDSTNNDYENSDVHAYLNQTLLNLFDNEIQSVIQEAKIPYHKGTGSGGTVKTGANGLNAKLFLLAAYEVGFTQSTDPAMSIDGAVLDYFNGATNTKRIAYMNGTAQGWKLRSPVTDSASGTNSAWGVLYNGAINGDYVHFTHPKRPALILPSDTAIDENYNVVA